jgi:hypothetical protein
MTGLRPIAALALALGAAVSAPALASTSVGVSVSVVQPGVYGRIDIGTLPQPAVVYPQPVVFAPPRVAVVQQPVYLYVPPGHQKDWGKHCGRYNACGVPVYFVQENWVRERYEGSHGHGNSQGQGNGKGNGKGKN